MKRDPAILAKERYDVLVVGAGIHGACVARDAALRGMRVALIDKGDFGGATSHNSLKLIHGGLRYLQHADFRRVRESIRERRYWLRAAPHLVRGQKFVIPLYGWGLKGPVAMWAAMRFYNLLAIGRNSGVRDDRRIPRAHLVSRREMLRLAPGIEARGLTGGAVWHDGQMLDADRVLLECVTAAAEAGADVANYIEATGAVVRDGALSGMRVTDSLDGGEGAAQFEVSARVTINTTGPWIEKLVGIASAPGRPRHDGLHKGLNLVVRKLFDHDVAIGVVSRLASDATVPRGGRLFFITPWRDHSIIGTSHVPYDGSPDDYDAAAREDDVQSLLDEINNALPGAKLERGDVLYCYGGLTPAEGGARARKTELRDHGQGLISVSGVKYTTARLVAERAVDLAAARLGGGFAPCSTESTESTESTRLPGSLKPGSVSPDSSLMERVVLAVREEMAVRLSDLVWRRMNRTHVGELPSTQLEACAERMARELGWDEARRERELRDARACQAAHCGAPKVVS